MLHKLSQIEEYLQYLRWHRRRIQRTFQRMHQLVLIGFMQLSPTRHKPAVEQLSCQRIKDLIRTKTVFINASRSLILLCEGRLTCATDKQARKAGEGDWVNNSSENRLIQSAQSSLVDLWAVSHVFFNLGSFMLLCYVKRISLFFLSQPG
jgi:hypothetical protein